MIHRYKKATKQTMLSENTISRIILMRRLLEERSAKGELFIFSHDIARQIHASPASIRRDLMTIGFSGSPTKGYDIQDLLKKTVDLLESPEGQRAALVGIGNLGRALLAFLPGRLPRISIVAAFDSNPEKVNKLLYGCKTFPIADLAGIVGEMGIRIGIVTVPAQSAQEVADQLVLSGVKGILNFAPIKLSAPAAVYVEHLDVTMSLEKVAYRVSNRSELKEKKEKQP
jgi:redox-sensing transcriptional repressor